MANWASHNKKVVKDIKDSLSSNFVDKLGEDRVGFDKLAKFLKDLSGINLAYNAKNQSLLSGRLWRVLQKYNLSSYSEYEQKLRGGNSIIVAEFVSCMTTNTTHFFRENKHFSFLKSVIPTILEKKRNKHLNELRIWCAASSTGQEQYSIAITILEAIPEFINWEIKFLATDIDRIVLNKAALGIYSKNEIDTIPGIYLQKYFNRVGSSDSYQVRPIISDRTNFAEFNIL